MTDLTEAQMKHIEQIMAAYREKADADAAASASARNAETELKVTIASARADASALQQLNADFSFSERQVGVRSFFHFARTLRIELAVVIAIMKLNDPEAMKTSPEMAAIMASLEQMRRMLDLRLAGIRAAMQNFNGMKLEVAEAYYQILLPKTRKQEGKWATGEKEFGEVHQDVLEQAVKSVRPPPPPA